MNEEIRMISDDNAEQWKKNNPELFKELEKKYNELNNDEPSK